MKRIITIILVIMLVAAMTVPAYAATVIPVGKTISFKMPNIKTVNISYSTVCENAKTAIQSNIVNNLFKAYPLNIKIG